MPTTERKSPRHPHSKTMSAPERDRPVDEMIATDDEVRELAYTKWEAAGRPCCDGVEYWLEAEHELLLGGPRK